MREREVAEIERIGQKARGGDILLRKEGPLMVTVVSSPLRLNSLVWVCVYVC